MDLHAQHNAHMSEGSAHSASGIDPHAQHKMGMIGSHSVSMNHGMKMYFNTDAPFHLLFEPWYIDTPGKLVGAFIGIFILASFYECCAALREKLLLKAACRDRCPTVVDDSNTTPLAGPSCPSCPVSSNDTTKGLVEPGNAGESSHSRLLITLRLRQFDKRPPVKLFDGLHMVQTLLHLIHMFIAYMLMLVVMTYNVYMLIAVISGFTLGYFAFARQRPLLLRSHTCCH
ncbi:hypothetical protein CRM22_009008 [Opisthorchis felineus]|uniref:Copper transport protein n=2 Tax=Opisthorchis felineus TaxID=147828 RepID=A0A4S2LGD7_OPIFE|nr:hypothetical protein CRM22_009008 [Opisthorchis felineus]